MKRNKNRLQYVFSIIIGMIVVGNAMAQDLHFSQFYEAPLLRNPALAGLYKGDVRIQGIYRTQWNSISFPYTTNSLNGEYKFSVGKGEDFLTVGGQVMYDKAGTVQLKTIELLPLVNFHKSLSDVRNTYLSLGFMGGVVNRRLNRAAVVTNNQYDGFFYNGALPDGESFSSGYAYTDMSVGMSFNTSIGAEENHDIFLGVGYHHLNKPLNSFYKNITHLPKWVFSGGLKLNLDMFTSITLNGDYVVQAPFKTMIGGAMFSKKPVPDEESPYTVHAGVYYRYNDAIIPVLKVDVNSMSLGISYDINVSTLAPASLNRGGFELSLSYLFSKPKEYAPVHCPRF